MGKWTVKNCVPVVTTAHGVEFVTIYINDNNSNFIAHAREDVPALVAEVERLRKALQTIAEHNIFTTPQIDIKDFARHALNGEARI